MIIGRLVTTRISPVVFRNFQKRNAYTRKANVISAPARNKISRLEAFIHSVVLFGAITAYPAYVMRTLKTGK
ncbi:hypothetical protein B7P43_G03790 [Cryptotermes secundus]|uniref:Uncharacterized protein n=1 Tax=Cryptotermes secundus TaxID=105785 RepID=A0A2J7R1Q8_9NEOP|nr:hypothetical protein B7P43_G03790 [Cryptotermes secundus]